MFARSNGYGAAVVDRGYEGEGGLALMGGQELSDEDWETSSQKRGVWEGAGCRLMAKKRRWAVGNGRGFAGGSGAGAVPAFAATAAKDGFGLDEGPGVVAGLF